MLRLVPLGCDGVGLDGVGLDGRGDELDGVGDCGEQLPFDTCRPLFAPAVCPTTLGTQLAASRLKEYGMLTVVVDWTFGPAGRFSEPGLDQVTLSKTFPLTCQ